MWSRASRQLKLLAVGVTATIATAVLITTSAAASQVRAFPGVIDSANLHSPVLATGPAAPGAVTVLYVDPTPKQLQTRHNDGEVALSQTTTADGRWSLRAGHVPADKVGPTGTANFTVMTDTGHGLLVGFFGEANVNRPAAAQRIGMRAMGAAQGPRPPNWTGVCEPTAGPSKTVDDLVGETFSSKKDGTQTFTYSYGASSTVGVGYNASLKGGTWSQNDTHSFGSTATASYGTKSGRASMYYEAEFQGDIVKWNCYVAGGSSGGYRTTAITGYDGAGYRVQPKKAPWNARDCVTQGGGMTITIEKSKAVQWSNGLNFSNLRVDVKLSSQTGYSTDAETKNHWDSRGLFCGVNAPPNNDGAYINVER